MTCEQHQHRLLQAGAIRPQASALALPILTSLFPPWVAAHLLPKSQKNGMEAYFSHKTPPPLTPLPSLLCSTDPLYSARPPEELLVLQELSLHARHVAPLRLEVTLAPARRVGHRLRAADESEQSEERGCAKVDAVKTF
jgi:hypothetical protein